MDGILGADRKSVAIAALLLLLFALWIVVLRDAWRAWQPARLLLLGRYAEARVAASRLGGSWMRILPGVRRSARYAVGCALHLEGRLEESITELAPLLREKEKLGRHMRYAICSIQAASLVLLDRDHAQARDLLEEAARISHSKPGPHPQPLEDIVLMVLARHGLGEGDAAAVLFTRVPEERSRGGIKLASVLLAKDREQQQAIFHALRGIYFVKVGRTTEAQRDLGIAAKSRITNVYVERARAMLEARTRCVEALDGPSSLAPQIVATANEPGEGESNDGGDDNTQ